ncbi:hypothetical protein PTKIN_Ptkin05aG0032300 [Pterospermum kingtungense]
MEKHKCKLCARTFSNGRALGGHMKGHLATHHLPPKKTQHQHQPGGDPTESASSSSSSSGEEQEQDKSREVVVVEEKSLGYGLRENPKKSFRFADPEFSFAADSGAVVVQDRESETESRNPTRRRSKRNRKVGANAITSTEEIIKKPKLLKKPSLVESPTESEPVSSVSDTPPVEDVAMCLMMLSRDVWKGNNNVVEHKPVKLLLEESEEIELNNNNNNNNKIRGKYRCGKCKKGFRSFDALDEHKRVCCACEAKNAGKVSNNDSKIFECPFCYRVFGSGQALGGHKRSHLLAAADASASASSNAAAAAAAANSSKFDNNLIDLNLPAPVEDDEFSVVSDA